MYSAHYLPPFCTYASPTRVCRRLRQRITRRTRMPLRMRKGKKKKIYRVLPFLIARLFEDDLAMQKQNILLFPFRNVLKVAGEMG